HASVVRREGNLCPRDGWAVVTRGGEIHVHPTRRGDPAEWAYVLAHCLLHLAFCHFRANRQDPEWNAACDLFVTRFLADLKFGRQPDDIGDPALSAQPGLLPVARDEERIYQHLREHGLPPALRAFGTAGPQHADL